MTLTGRIACLLALMGLFLQFSAQASELAGFDFFHNITAKACSQCPGESSDSTAPVESATHDHCGAICHLGFNAMPEGEVSFHVRAQAPVSTLAVTQEKSQEGFPVGLFIPPRLS